MRRKPVLRVRVDLSRRELAAGLVVLLLLGAAAELSSEQITLTSYYPSPAGVYRTLKTTMDAILARDGGSVGIGTAHPRAKLDVAGDAVIDGTLRSRGAVLGAAEVSGPALFSSSVTFRGHAALSSLSVALLTVGPPPSGMPADAVLTGGPGGSARWAAPSPSEGAWCGAAFSGGSTLVIPCMGTNPASGCPAGFVSAALALSSPGDGVTTCLKLPGAR